MATCPTCHTRYTDDVVHCNSDGTALVPDALFATADADLKPGDMVGEYRVEGKLGEGGFGTVYRAVHPVIGKTCALKALHRQFSSNPQMVSRFIAEARAVNQIRHRNIIDIFSFGALPDGRQYYLMELLDGEAFDQYLQRRGALSPEEALPLLRPIARALDAAHAAGIVHRDLKPENVFLVHDGEGGMMPKLLDFGIAKLMSADTVSGGHKTRTGAPMGTPYYMSPEQCRGAGIDHRTDVYAFGVLCHLTLTGRLPFNADSVMDLLMKHMAAPPPRASEVRPELNPELDAPILQMLAKEPGDRPQSVGDAVENLAGAAQRAGYAVVAKMTSGKASTVAVDAAAPGSLPRASTEGPVAPTAARTLTPAATDIGPRPRAPLLIAAALGFVALGGLLVTLFVLRPHDDSHAQATAIAKSPPDPIAAASATAAPADQPVPTPPPAEVAITVEATSKTATVFLGTTKLGTGPGPYRIPYGAASVTLSVKAPGYNPASVEVVPTASATVTVPLTKAPTQPVVPKDLADPYGAH